MRAVALGAPLGACDKTTVGDPLETELDRLFQLPPGELVAARNALAETLRRAGDKASAARVKAIKRATPIAWALNQVHFAHPALLEQAREHTNELRALQTQRGVDTRQLAHAVEQQRGAAQAVIDAALRAGRGAGLSDAVLQPRKLLTTIQAWLAGKSDEAPGRMTVELEASGFDAFAGVALTAAPAVPRTDRAPALEEATRMLKEREQDALVARERVHARTAEQAQAQQAHAQAAISVREAERQLSELRAALEQRASSVERCTSALTEARAQAAQAEEAVAAARAELSAQKGY